MRKVATAQMYRPMEMGSFGKADGMYIRQFQFPDTYKDSERILTVDHDRCFMWDHAHATRCFRERTGSGDLNFENWVRGSFDKNVLAFIKELTKADDSVEWTGYRVLGTVNRSNGYPVWTLQLFAKDPKSKTKVYDGCSAPNILIPKGNEFDISGYPRFTTSW